MSTEYEDARSLQAEANEQRAIEAPQQESSELVERERHSEARPSRTTGGLEEEPIEAVEHLHELKKETLFFSTSKIAMPSSASGTTSK
jgi:hypothetical protein